MPQAYSVATGPAAARTSSPEAVSYTRGAGPLPGSTGTSTRRQESMSVRLSRGISCLARPVGTEGRCGVSTALRCAGLGHRHGRSLWGLRECTVSVPAGRLVALVGPNGSGKTTLMSMAAGLLPVTEGTVELAGGAPAQRLDRIG